MKQISFYSIILLIVSMGCKNNNKDWFLVNKLDNSTYIISEPESSQGNSSFLIIGDNEAILFDSGTGENKGQEIIQVIDSITKMPVTLLLSHFHFDHIGNVNEFKRIGIPEIQILKNRLSDDRLIKLTENDILAKNTITLKISRLFPVEKEIDLGNRKIKILYTPGHSKESISIIDQDNGYIFTGDLLYNGLLLIDDCQDFIGSINNILKNTGTDYRVFGSHGKPEFKYEQLAQAKKAVECYLDKACPFKPEQTINIFGRNRDVFKIDNVSFIVGYTEGFKFGK